MRIEVTIKCYEEGTREELGGSRFALLSSQIEAAKFNLPAATFKTYWSYAMAHADSYQQARKL